ncbi:MAG: hypothetical protein ACRC5C_04895, partial [Bacilli bacterium]
TSIVAEKLNLASNRVAIRAANVIGSIQGLAEEYHSPAFVTPLGIAIQATQHTVNYINVSVNNESVTLYDMSGLSVQDAVIAIGTPVHRLFGAPGLAYFITVDGKSLQIPGTLGEAPTITVNGHSAQLSTPIKNGDHIEIIRGDSGKPPVVSIAELYDNEQTLSVVFNGQTQTYTPSYFLNGKKAEASSLIHDGDVISCSLPKVVKDIIEEHVQNWNDLNQEEFIIFVNDERVSVPSKISGLLVNHRPCSPDTVLYEGMEISFQEVEKPTLALLEQQLSLVVSESITVCFNTVDYILEKQRGVWRNEDGTPIDRDTVLSANMKLFYQSIEESGFIIQDIFAVAQMPTREKHHINYTLTKNRYPASFTDCLENNDRIELYYHD